MCPNLARKSYTCPLAHDPSRLESLGVDHRLYTWNESYSGLKLIKSTFSITNQVMPTVPKDAPAGKMYSIQIV